MQQAGGARRTLARARRVIPNPGTESDTGVAFYLRFANFSRVLICVPGNLMGFFFKKFLGICIYIFSSCPRSQLSAGIRALKYIFSAKTNKNSRFVCCPIILSGNWNVAEC